MILLITACFTELNSFAGVFILVCKMQHPPWLWGPSAYSDDPFLKNAFQWVIFLASKSETISISSKTKRVFWRLASGSYWLALFREAACHKQTLLIAGPLVLRSLPEQIWASASLDCTKQSCYVQLCYVDLGTIRIKWSSASTCTPPA